MSQSADAGTRAVLDEAGRRAGLDVAGAELVRLGENALYRLPGGIIARITRAGQAAAAAREVAVARWLEASQVPAVRVWSGVEQPVAVDGRAVTWWRELPPHRPGTAYQVATALRRLHDLPPPAGIDIGRLDPFVRLTERIDRAVTLDEADRRWMRRHLEELEARYLELPPGLPECVVHGDAWIGNVVSTADGEVVLLDLERCSIGPPEWDLVSTAVKALTIAGITREDYEVFVQAYGHDVTAWAGFTTMRDIREFRMTCMAAQVAAENPARQDEVVLRLACLRGERGPRPWPWQPVP
ncbi:aminoglycoside phosphotransferase (APT) family kinase protein [Thermocatellispora tengchongensis]|uniref:Aminoglycoside phosphotransferase (APT) family kinase protein n=1 Tax=Thermocatellispora tengchongensis TaxID=1073253 RepID=A0A840PM34_9ACTN|nr:aminoglycoside phosphotransferase family protein [Thermocatellispora tengchongensis]MBB5138107.1 aminoglycoside phosphotransferase (APT) family kinase protein [Thermocatellispora tengchongensis]